MEQTFDIQKPTEKIYKDKAIWLGTFIGGPLAAGYIIAENFKAFGEYDKAKKTWFYTIIVTIIIFSGIFLIPDSVKIPNQIIPLVYTVTAYYLLKHFQGQNIENHINSGGEFFGWWRIIGIGLIGLSVVLLTVFAIVFLTDTLAAPDKTKTYGAMNHEIAYNDSNISDSEVDILAAHLTETTFFDEDVTKYVYVKKESNTYELFISVVEGLANDNEGLQPFINLRSDLQSYYPNNKIVFKLVVDNLDNIVIKLE